MKSHRVNRVITSESEVRRLAYREAQKIIDNYNLNELPKIKVTYAKLFLLSMAGCKGIGRKRMREVMQNLGEATCEMHNMLIDDVFDDIADKSLREQGLWEIYEEFSNGECVPMFEGSKYLEVKRE